MGHPLKNTFLLEDEHRLTGPMAFNLMIKPAGSLCNLDCSYCYYLDKADIYGGRQPVMSIEMLETVIREYIRANDVPDVTFNWHGGEPLVVGLDFYRKAIGFQKKYADGKNIFNTLQTNGTLITEDFASFFHDNAFLIGISIDGPEDIHDRFRRDKGGAPTFDKVIRGLERLYRHGVEYNTMTTINKASEGRGAEVYEFLKSSGSRYMQFMPVVEHVISRPGARPYIVPPMTEGAVLAPWSVSSSGFGRFMCDIFDRWVLKDVGKYFVNLFDATLANMCGVLPGTCAYARTCGNNMVVEHNGDLYPCDHFVYPRYRLGNISEDPLRNVVESPDMLRFGTDKRNELPSRCLACRYGLLCMGECPKHRFSRTDSGDAGLNALCEGYYSFFEHTEPYMKVMKELLDKGLPPAMVMQWAGNK